MKNLVMAVSVCVFSAATANSAAAAVSAKCEAEYGGITETLLVAPGTDVFKFHSVALGERFKFRAQYLQDRTKLKTYVYELRENVPALIHASEHQLSPQNCQQKSEGFGLNKVYSSDLERELFFQCFAVCE